MITIYNTKKSEMLTHPNGEVYYLCELRGLSTDSKPTIIGNGNIENGSVFIEIDTQEVYLYDSENSAWLPEVEENDNKSNEEQREVKEDSKTEEVR